MDRAARAILHLMQADALVGAEHAIVGAKPSFDPADARLLRMQRGGFVSGQVALRDPGMDTCVLTGLACVHAGGGSVEGGAGKQADGQ